MPRPSEPQTIFGKRLREARVAKGIPQDRLGVLIGIDEGSSSARISRYETGAHEPPYSTSQRLAEVLRVPIVFLYCADDRLADFLLNYARLSDRQKRQVLALAADLSSGKT